MRSEVLQPSLRVRPTIWSFSRKRHEVDQDDATNDMLDCAVGSNALGTSPNVVEAANNYSWRTLSTYPDTSYRTLKRQICQFWSRYAQLSPENIKLANGAGIVLSRLNQLFIEPGVSALGYAPQFKDYMEDVVILGGRFQGVPLQASEGFKFRVAGFLNTIGTGFAVVYVDNPNNPTGQYIGLDEVEAIASECARRGTVLVVDEAFGDYVPEDCSAVSLLNRYSNVVVTRTFSKGMGIADFRVGYGVMSSELGRYYDRVDPPFQISSLAAFLAGEALHDHQFVEANRERIRAHKARLTSGLRERGYSVAETHDTCPLFLLGLDDEDIDLRGQLLAKGIRTIAGTDFENLGSNYVRVNTPADVEEFLARLDGRKASG